MKKSALSCLLVAGLFCAPIFSAEAQERRKSRPLPVDVYKKPAKGGYSYRKADVIDTRRFVDTSSTRQSQGGPFDSGFFFETPQGPFGGTAPYFH
jgi:hypothetical protein